MGTRSLTYIEESYETCVADEENNNEVHKTTKNILCMYRQYDGYPSGHGMELAEFLQDFNIVNGYSITDPKPSANGMGCLAAQIIAHYKDGIGNIYIHHPDDKDCGEEYTYTIYKKDGKVHMRIYDIWAKEIIFDGKPEKFIALKKEIA
tara:strand:+ start:5005 stop:5451 length:447 start_codon:yes stop_codon:yes gene_type:complete